LTTWLSELLSQHQAAAASAPAADDELPKDIDEFRDALARRMDAFVERHLAKQREAGGGEPEHS